MQAVEAKLKACDAQLLLLLKEKALGFHVFWEVESPVFLVTHN